MSSKAKLRKKRHLKQALRRVGMCLVCAPLYLYQAERATAQKFAAWPCPSCGREIALDLGDESERGREALHTLARCYAYQQKIHVDGFTVTYDGEQVYEVPACACGPQPCHHAHLHLDIKSPQEGEPHYGNEHH